MLSVLSLATVIVAATPADDFTPSIKALEEAFVTKGTPELLLGIGALHGISGVCKAEVDAYARFYAVCKDKAGCAAFERGTEAVRATLRRCLEVKQTIWTSPKATYDEVQSILQMAVAVDEVAALMALQALERTTGQDELDELRRRAWKMLEGAAATRAQVFYLTERLMDDDPALSLSGLKAVAAQFDAPKPAELTELRQAMLTSLFDKARSSMVCRINPNAEPAFVTVGSSPWSKVFINGREAGATPLHKVRVTAGCISLRLVDSKGRSVERVVTLRPNLNTTLLYTFESETLTQRARTRF